VFGDCNILNIKQVRKMTYAPSKSLSCDEFITKYGDNPHFELADGELIDMEPTGSHQTVGGKLATKISLAIGQTSYPWFIPLTCLIRSSGGTIRRPDIIVLDESKLSLEPQWEQLTVITFGSSIKLVVEIVSTNWETDYARKTEEYALMGINEYWIVDFKGLGGTAFIGKPKQPTFTVCQLIVDEYHQTQFRLGDSIISPTFPELQLRLDDVLPYSSDSKRSLKR
jgi:Uma2 family endonuclease